MNKIEFLEALKARLKALPEEDRDRFVDEYSEKIDALMEDGMSEEDAVASIGDPGDVALKILVENEELVPKKENSKPLATTAYYKGEANDNRSSENNNRRRSQSGSYDSYDDNRRYEKKSGNTALKVILIIICFPFIIAAAATAFGLFIGACGLLFGLLAGACGMAVGFVAAGIGSIVGLISCILSGKVALGLVTLGAGCVLAGIGLLIFPGVKAMAAFSVKVIKGMFTAVARLFRGRTA